MLGRSRKLPDRRTLSWEPVLDQRRTTVMQMPGVVGVGIGGRQGQEVVVVTVLRGQNVPEAPIRQALAGLTVKFEESEPYRLS